MATVKVSRRRNRLLKRGRLKFLMQAFGSSDTDGRSLVRMITTEGHEPLSDNLASGHRALFTYLVNLCDVSAREFNDGNSPSTRGIWLNKNADTHRLSLRKRISQA
jgi:hypothetical protein